MTAHHGSQRKQKDKKKELYSPGYEFKTFGCTSRFGEGQGFVIVLATCDKVAAGFRSVLHSPSQKATPA